MTIILRPEHEKFIAQAMQTGAYQNPDEVNARALETLNSEDEWLHDRKSAIAEKIERAFGQFEHREFFSAEESQAEIWRRIAGESYQAARPVFPAVLVPGCVSTRREAYPHHGRASRQTQREAHLADRL
jgi:Arc/MetJ-type ribon-helix-helix transcriptional regulator